MKDRGRTTGVRSERAVLVGVFLDAPADPEHPLAELAGLAATAGAVVVGELTQRRERPDQTTYLGSGKPILALLPPGEARDLVTHARTGFVLPPHNVDSIATKWLTLFHRHQRGSIPVDPNWQFIQQFDMTRQQKHFADLILSVLPAAPEKPTPPPLPHAHFTLP